MNINQAYNKVESDMADERRTAQFQRLNDSAQKNAFIANMLVIAGYENLARAVTEWVDELDVE